MSSMAALMLTRCASWLPQAGAAPGDAQASSSGLRCVDVDCGDASAAGGDANAAALALADAHGVPAGEPRFALLSRVRCAREATTAEGRRATALRRLQALYTLMQLGPDYGARDRRRQAPGSAFSWLARACVICPLSQQTLSHPPLRRRVDVRLPQRRPEPRARPGGNGVAPSAAGCGRCSTIRLSGRARAAAHRRAALPVCAGARAPARRARDAVLRRALPRAPGSAALHSRGHPSRCRRCAAAGTCGRSWRRRTRHHARCTGTRRRCCCIGCWLISDGDFAA